MNAAANETAQTAEKAAAAKTPKASKPAGPAKPARAARAPKVARGKSDSLTSADLDAMRVVLSPVVSEKSTMMGEKNNQVAFRVTGDATKAQVKSAIEAFFKVQVAAVNMVNLKGKTRRFGRSVGQRQDSRKAYVTLAEGQEINFAESK